MSRLLHREPEVVVQDDERPLVGRERLEGLVSWSRSALPPVCHNRRAGHELDCCCSDHVAAPRGSRTGTQGGVSTEEAGRIPRDLAERFRVALEHDRGPDAEATRSKRLDDGASPSPVVMRPSRPSPLRHRTAMRP